MISDREKAIVEGIVIVIVIMSVCLVTFIAIAVNQAGRADRLETEVENLKAVISTEENTITIVGKVYYDSYYGPQGTRDSSDSPASNVTVLLRYSGVILEIEPGNRQWIYTTGEIVDWTETDQNGEYRFEITRPQTDQKTTALLYRIEVWTQNYASIMLDSDLIEINENTETPALGPTVLLITRYEYGLG